MPSLRPVGTVGIQVAESCSLWYVGARLGQPALYMVCQRCMNIAWILVSSSHIFVLVHRLLIGRHSELACDLEDEGSQVYGQSDRNRSERTVFRIR